MKKTNVLLAFAVALTLSSCFNTGKTLPSATGSIYEALVVVDNEQWNSQLGEIIKGSLGADMPCMPQMEPTMDISQVSPQAFDDMLKPVRNILYIDVNPDRYTQNKVVYLRNIYSQPQSVCRVQSADFEQCTAFLKEEMENIRQWFVREELTRQGKFYKGYNTDARLAVQQRFGCDVFIPDDYILVRNEKDFVWAVNDKGSMRRDFVMWAYPYTDNNTFTQTFLEQKRDEILGQQVEGAIEGSYMGTEYKQIPPQMQAISVQNNSYCAELRGLWKMKNGAAMGGPFVQHTRLDEFSQKVITAEVFVFAPGQKKRNAIRQAEAILYTIKLPQDIKNVNDIDIVGNSEEQ